MNPFEQPVRLYMTSPVHTISPTDEVAEAERRMRTLSISSLAVLSNRDHHLAGVVTRTDLLALGRFRAEEQGQRALLRLPHEAIGEIMNHHPITVRPDTPVADAARLLAEHGIHRVFVEEERRPVGVLSTKDVLRAVYEARVKDPISRYMSSPAITIEVDTPLSEATDRLAEEKVRGLVVVENEWPVGVFTQVDALEARDQAAATPVEEVMGFALLCLDVDTPVWRAAAQMAQTRARRVIAVSQREVRGILTGIDLARAACP